MKNNIRIKILIAVCGVILVCAAVSLAQMTATEDPLYDQIAAKIAKTNDLFAKKEAAFTTLTASRNFPAESYKTAICPSFAEWYVIFQDKVANYKELSELSQQKKFKVEQSMISKLIGNSTFELIHNQDKFDQLAAKYGCGLSGKRSDGSVNTSPRYAPFGDFDYFGSTAKIENKPDQKTLTEAEKAKQKFELDEFLEESIIYDADNLIVAGYRTAALKSLNEVIRVNPTNAAAYAERAQVFDDLGQFDAGMNDANRSIALDQDNPVPYIWRAWNFRVKKDEASAAADEKMALGLVESAIRKNPNSAKIYYIRGFLEQRFQFNAAIADFTKAIALDPKFTNAYYYRGFAYSNSGDKWFESLADFNKVIELSAKSVNGYKMRGSVYRMVGEFEKSAADLRRALELDPGNQELKDYVALYSGPEKSYEVIDRYKYFVGLYKPAKNLFEQAFAKYAEMDKTPTDKGKRCQFLADYYQIFKDYRTGVSRIYFITQHPEIDELKNPIANVKTFSEAFENVQASFKLEAANYGCNFKIE